MESRDFPFNIMDVASLLHLKRRREGPNSIYVDCPFCGDQRGKMNLNYVKNVWRCNYCQEKGGMLALYARVHGISNSDAYQEIYETLVNDGPAPGYSISAAAPKEETLAERASPEEMHRTYSALLSMLTLTPAHWEHLRTVRGLTKEQVEQFGFRSTPQAYQCQPITETLMRQGYKVKGVPGFYIDDRGRWTVRFHQRTSGILIPILSIVVKFNDVAYGQSLGRTGHHYKDGLAFKFEDDLFETKMPAVEWNPSRSGEITPVAILEPVQIDGCTVSRATLHNLSFMEKLELMPGNRVLISKRNMIIPHVEENLDRGDFDMQRLVPASCPCCGMPTRIHTTKSYENGKERVTKSLYCDNTACATRHLRQFVHFVSKKAMDIEGLSEATLEKLIGKGWLHTYDDIYSLDRYATEIISMEGFGEKSWTNLWDAIQRSRNTTFDRFLVAMDIPQVGSTASKALGKVFHGSLDEFEDAVCSQYDFTQLPDFGDTLNSNIREWFQNEENWYLWGEMRKVLHVAQPEEAPVDADGPKSPIAGMTIVVTGKVEPYTRDQINDFIVSKGGIAGSSVTKKTDCLVCGENAGSKLQKARDLGKVIMTPAEFFSLFEPVA